MTQKKELGKSKIKSTSSGVIVYLKEKNYSGNDCITKMMLNSEFYMQKRFVPRKFRTKLPGHCTEREIEPHENSAMDRVKNEIIILKNRASEFKTQHEEIDNNVLQKIETESTDPDVFTAPKAVVGRRLQNGRRKKSGNMEQKRKRFERSI